MKLSILVCDTGRRLERWAPYDEDDPSIAVTLAHLFSAMLQAGLRQETVPGLEGESIEVKKGSGRKDFSEDLHDAAVWYSDDESEFEEIFNAPNKYYYDYPNSRKTLSFITRNFSGLIKKIYKQKPMTLVETDVRGENN